jgi:ABC-2 type transport system permease protein
VPARTAARPRLIQILASLLEADFTVQVRNGRALLLSVALPLVLLFALGAGKRGALFPPTSRLGLAIGLGITSIAILGYSATMARDRETGVFQRLRVTPAPTWAIMASRLAVQIVAIIAMTIVVFLAGRVLINFSIAPGAYALTIVVAILGAAEFLSVGQVLVGLLKSADTVNAVGRLVFIPLVALGVFGNISVFGTTLETIARWSPGGALFSMLAAAMAPATWNSNVWWSVLVSVGYSVVFASIGIRWFQWEAR